jgi:hypothetical protein
MLSYQEISCIFWKPKVCYCGVGVDQLVYYLTTDWVTGVQSLAEAKNFSSSVCFQTSSDAHPSSFPVGTRSPSQGKVWPGR